MSSASYSIFFQYAAYHSPVSLKMKTEDTYACSCIGFKIHYMSFKSRLKLLDSAIQILLALYQWLIW